MRLQSIELNNFRVFRNLKLDFAEGINLITGRNGQGKTSLLEAVYLLSSSKSFRTGDYREMINYHTDYLSVEGKVEIDNGTREEHSMRVYLDNEKKEFRLDKGKISAKEFYNYFGAVSLTNDDLNMVRGGPEYRRKFIDRAISGYSRVYLENYLSLNKALKQRNHLLKSAKEKNKAPDKLKVELDSWNKTFAGFASEVINSRLLYLTELEDKVDYNYSNLFRNSEKLSMDYICSFESKKKTKLTRAL
ncbi:MAG: DNA replication and repair protein RecF [Acidobacteria bacterium]|nr:DNA replication and repair protein RecF [Acidobacteriota bacterium]